MGNTLNIEIETDSAPGLLSKLRVALIHYWFVKRRGGERVIEELGEIFPQADLYALVAEPQVLAPVLQKMPLRTSFLQHVPGSRRWHRHLLPLYPIALEQFDLRGYDLVISSESGPAKGVITSTKTCHVCYCSTPMRYLWDMYPDYRKAQGVRPWSRLAFSLTAHYVRLWDLATAARVDYFVANSNNVAARIRKHYRRDAAVIYPPIAVSLGYLAEEIEDYYLFVGELVDYKRVDLAIEACNRLRRSLRIIGDGEQYKRLRRLAGPTIEFLGFLDDEVVREHYARCRALIFPAHEDFGIVPVEAQCFGRPVIAYGDGGVLETVIGFYPGEPMRPETSSGVFFARQTVQSLVEAILAFEAVEHRFSPEFIRCHTEPFDATHFKKRMSVFLAEKVQEFRCTSLPHQSLYAT